jgi:hypothetical protein
MTRRHPKTKSQIEASQKKRQYTAAQIRHLKSMNNIYPWKAKPGDVLEGVYESREPRTGTFGQYEVFIIRCQKKRVSISGVSISAALFGVALGTRVRIHYKGVRTEMRDDDIIRNIKQFELLDKPQTGDEHARSD